MYKFSPGLTAFYRDDVHGPVIVQHPIELVPAKINGMGEEETPAVMGAREETIRPNLMPADVVGPISEARHAELMKGQNEGQRIVAGPDGFPLLKPRDYPQEATAEAAAPKVPLKSRKAPQ